MPKSNQSSTLSRFKKIFYIRLITYILLIVKKVIFIILISFSYCTGTGPSYSDNAIKEMQELSSERQKEILDLAEMMINDFDNVEINKFGYAKDSFFINNNDSIQSLYKILMIKVDSLDEYIQLNLLANEKFKNCIAYEQFNGH